MGVALFAALFGFLFSSLIWIFFLMYADKNTVLCFMDWLDSLHQDGDSQ